VIPQLSEIENAQGAEMREEASLALARRVLQVVEDQRPEMADRFMRVPLEVYQSDELALKEREIFETQPLAMIAASEIANSHDYLVRSAMNRSILLTRDADGEAHAFLNYCRHRGAEPASGCGNQRVFTCPYHGWNYDTKGQLSGLPLRDRYEGLDLSALGLVELPSEERHGLIWVVLRAGSKIDVASHLGELDADLASLGCEGMSYYNSLPAAPLSTNWKSVVEGLLESLHVPFVHKGTFDQNPQASGVDLAIYDAFGPHVRYSLPIIGREEAAKIRETPEESWEAARIFASVWWISPGLLIAEELYGLIYADLTPGSTVSSAVFRYGWLSPTLTAPQGQPSPEEMAARAAQAVGQDQPVWEGCGRGLTYGAHDYALIGRNEKGVQLFHEAIARETGYQGIDYC
jgi:phenylpropionate dioxygenase-like ring-hydroxylating dioxygenase large terminal subunit